MWIPSLSVLPVHMSPPDASDMCVCACSSQRYLRAVSCLFGPTQHCFIAFLHFLSRFWRFKNWNHWVPVQRQICVSLQEEIRTDTTGGNATRNRNWKQFETEAQSNTAFKSLMEPCRCQGKGGKTCAYTILTCISKTKQNCSFKFVTQASVDK